ATEETPEEIAQIADVADVDALVARASTGTRSSCAGEPTREAADAGGRHLPNLVVLLALLLVPDHVVRGGDLLEALLRLLVAGVGIGMVLLRELAIGLLDLVLGRVLRDAERRVVVLLEPLPPDVAVHRGAPFRIGSRARPPAGSRGPSACTPAEGRRRRPALPLRLRSASAPRAAPGRRAFPPPRSAAGRRSRGCPSASRTRAPRRGGTC